MIDFFFSSFCSHSESTHRWNSQTQTSFGRLLLADVPSLGLTWLNTDDDHLDRMDGQTSTDSALFHQCNCLAANGETAGTRANTPPVSALLQHQYRSRNKLHFLSGWGGYASTPLMENDCPWLCPLMAPFPHAKTNGSMDKQKRARSREQRH